MNQSTESQQHSNPWAIVISNAIYMIGAIVILYLILPYIHDAESHKGMPGSGASIPVSQPVANTIKAKYTDGELFLEVVANNVRPGAIQKAAENWLRLTNPDLYELQVGSVILSELLLEEDQQRNDPVASQSTHDLATRMMDGIEAIKNQSSNSTVPEKKTVSGK